MKSAVRLWVQRMVLIAGSFAGTACLLSGFTQCEHPGIRRQKAAGQTESRDATQRPDFRVGLVLDKGGKDDRSFNSAAVVGAERAMAELGAKVRIVESADDTAFEPALRAFSERGWPLVISIGFSQKDAVEKVARAYPKTQFAIVDAHIVAPNVLSLMFAEHEGSYVMGYLAARASRTGKIGFIGGMEVALIRRFLLGYEAGARAANPKVQIIHHFVGVTAQAWANPTRGKELALNQIGQGADVLFHAAGASGMGMFDAVESSPGTLAIGVDSNQNAVKPGRVLTSMLKRVDTAVFDAIESAKAARFQPGVKVFGLADRGIDAAIDSSNKDLIAPYQSDLKEVISRITSGEVVVPDYYVEQKKPKASRL